MYYVMRLTSKFTVLIRNLMFDLSERVVLLCGEARRVATSRKVALKIREEHSKPEVQLKLTPKFPPLRGRAAGSHSGKGITFRKLGRDRNF